MSATGPPANPQQTAANTRRTGQSAPSSEPYLAVAAFALLGGSPGRAFPGLVPAAAPARWPHLTLPNGTAVLSYPPSLRLVSSDADAVSAAQVSPGER